MGLGYAKQLSETPPEVFNRRSQHISELAITSPTAAIAALHRVIRLRRALVRTHSVTARTASNMNIFTAPNLS